MDLRARKKREKRRRGEKKMIRNRIYYRLPPLKIHQVLYSVRRLTEIVKPGEGQRHCFGRQHRKSTRAGKSEEQTMLAIVGNNGGGFLLFFKSTRQNFHKISRMSNGGSRGEEEFSMQKPPVFKKKKIALRNNFLKKFVSVKMKC